MTEFRGVYEFQHAPKEAKRARRVDMSLPVGTLPMYEMSDLMPASASGVNKATDYTLKLNIQKEEEILKVDEAALRFNQACANYRGAHVIRQDELPFRTTMRKDSQFFRVPEDHYLNTANEAPRGRNAVNLQAKMSFAMQKVKTTGASNNVKAKGFERDDNQKIYPRLPTGLPMSVDPMRPTSDGIRINSTIVQPIAVFPQAGF